MTAATYLEQFQNLVEVASHTRASAGLHDRVVIDVASEMGVDLTSASRDETIAIQTVAKERFLATTFLLKSGWSRYGRLIEDIENAYIQGMNRYLAPITAAYNLLVNWKQDPRNFIQSVWPTNDGVSFTTTGDHDSISGDTNTTQGRRSAPGKGRNPPDITTIICFKCGKMGHYSPECPSGDNASVSAISAITSNTTAHPSASTMITAGISRGEFDNTNQHFQFLQSNGTALAQGGGRREKGKGQRAKGKGQREKGEGRREKGEGRREKGERRKAKGEGRRANIPSNWILLDSQCTIDVFQCSGLLWKHP
jgi:Zinc knuckle